MPVLKWSSIGLAVALVTTVLAGQVGMLAGSPPSDLGVRGGRLKPPSTSPNSVSSQAGLYTEHPQHSAAAIAPLALQGDGAATLARLRNIVDSTSGARVVRSEPGYLYVQYTTRLMKYVDDVEFWFDPSAGVIQVRSASRLGESDLGANRSRIEAIRVRLALAPPAG